MSKMEWPKLLSHRRLGKLDKATEAIDPARPPFHQDFDRIVFSTAFRRLQDKTQVFPLADNDFVHTRLTHSLETSCMGRSLGTAVGQDLVKRDRRLRHLHPSDIGAIVSSACLAHDIGNPPFGHSGEDAIRHWFKTSKTIDTFRADLSEGEQKDLEFYEGNAQGFRLLARLQMAKDKGGLQLTCAALGAFAKYPAPSSAHGDPSTPWAKKKFGYFQSEAALFDQAAGELGLFRQGQGWCRHPLVFLVEAADDICYRIIDFEDGFRLGHVTYNEVHTLFDKVIGKKSKAERLPDRQRNHVGILRAQAIGSAIQQTTQAFLRHHDSILAGELMIPLIKLPDFPSGPALEKIQKVSIPKIYGSEQVVRIEAAGFEVLGGLLELFASAQFSPRRSAQDKTLLRLVPAQFRNDTLPRYHQLLDLLDFVSGMTDSYAVSLYKMLKGISLPGR
ncbi:dGTPase [Verrucomicrobium sp. GAS474]|uniref:deoxyguanosinetriphosphate triphosphohydrolase n=1 Tax=Verrucomicrobium sp. GAS474 TaxID=1882831 RepID=UPI00087ADEDA|nr:deoxyguanosinetriphosphate triphosphohydrolase [Verrucomicrobium sp. GAS474]SDU25618.1 dGTPase [Verrucomicrobium sp. GAS474]